MVGHQRREINKRGGTCTFCGKIGHTKESSCADPKAVATDPKVLPNSVL